MTTILIAFSIGAVAGAVAMFIAIAAYLLTHM